VLIIYKHYWFRMHKEGMANVGDAKMQKGLFDARIASEGARFVGSAWFLPINTCHFIGLRCGMEIAL
jgi:hypothetical protein